MSQFSMNDVEKIDPSFVGGPLGFKALDPEDPERYVHGNVETLTVNESDGSTKLWVSAGVFMDVQKERDDLRRAMAFVNGFRVHPGLPLSEFLERVAWACETVGFTVDQGKAHNELVRWAREETRKAKERADDHQG